MLNPLVPMYGHSHSKIEDVCFIISAKELKRGPDMCGLTLVWIYSIQNYVCKMPHVVNHHPSLMTLQLYWSSTVRPTGFLLTTKINRMWMRDTVRYL